MTLKISDLLELPLDFVTATAAVLARKGRGKSYTSSVIAEELLDAKQQIVVLDPTGVWWGLRSTADGAGVGYAIPVFGGKHADLPLEATAGRELATAIAEEHFSCILDTSRFTRGEETRFLADFLETLYRKNEDPLHLFCDEADVYAPQSPMGDEARTLGACQNIVRRGRVRGIGCTMITQRPAVLNKSVLSQVDMLAILGVSHPADLKQIGEWTKVHDTEGVAGDMMKALPKQPIGTPWWWWPDADIFKEVPIRKRRTFDSGRTPKVGERKAVAKVLAPVDLERLGATIAATVERAKEGDTKALRAELAKVRAQLEVASAAQIPREVEAELEQLRAIEGYYREFRSKVRAVARQVGDLTGQLEDLADTSDTGRRSPYAEPVSAVRPARTEVMLPVRAGSGPGDQSLGKAQRAILAALAQYPQGRTKAQVALLSGYAVSGGGFRNNLSALRVAGQLEGDPDHLVITSAGLAALGSFEPLPSPGAPLREHWLRDLDKAGAAIIRALASEGGSAAKDFVALKAGYEPEGGGFRNALSRLRTLGLIEGSKKIVLAEELR